MRGEEIDSTWAYFQEVLAIKEYRGKRLSKDSRFSGENLSILTDRDESVKIK